MFGRTIGVVIDFQIDFICREIIENIEKLKSIFNVRPVTNICEFLSILLS